MFKIFSAALEKIETAVDLVRSGKISKEDIAFRYLPHFTLDIIRRYFRLETKNIHFVPPKGGAIIISNHSGYSGFDALMIKNEVERLTGRKVHILAHKLWFVGKHVQVLSEKMGLIEADLNESLKILNRDEILLLFPEGEAGNFKPSQRSYVLQEFKRGFIRLSLITGKPIIPVFVLGAEEAHINLGQIKFTKFLIGSVLPLPLNMIPLPTKWTIKFLPPLVFPNTNPKDALNRGFVRKKAQEIKRFMQREILRELRARKGNEFSGFGDAE